MAKMAWHTDAHNCLMNEGPWAPPWQVSPAPLLPDYKVLPLLSFCPFSLFFPWGTQSSCSQIHIWSSYSLSHETSLWLPTALKVKTKFLNPSYKSHTVWIPCLPATLFHCPPPLESPLHVPTCSLYSSHTDRLLIQVTIHAPSCHRAFAHSLPSLYWVNSHLPFSS